MSSRQEIIERKRKKAEERREAERLEAERLAVGKSTAKVPPSDAERAEGRAL